MSSSRPPDGVGDGIGASLDSESWEPGPVRPLAAQPVPARHFRLRLRQRPAPARIRPAPTPPARTPPARTQLVRAQRLAPTVRRPAHRSERSPKRAWADLVHSTDSDAEESVHLASWPTADPHVVNDELRAQVNLVRRLVELGRAARANSKIKTRQPLRRAVVAAADRHRLPADLRREITDEINVLGIEQLTSGGRLRCWLLRSPRVTLVPRHARLTVPVSCIASRSHRSADQAGSPRLRGLLWINSRPLVAEKSLVLLGFWRLECLREGIGW